MELNIYRIIFNFLLKPSNNMPVSSNSFFHFINNGEHVLPLIIQNGFRTSASDEVVEYHSENGDTSFISHCIPMVCFCDIPLSLVDDHAKFYCGHETEIFGIGMTREWGLRSNLNPVSYVNDRSYLATIKFYQGKLYNQIVRFSEKVMHNDLTMDHIAPSVIKCWAPLANGHIVDTYYSRTILYDKFVKDDYYRRVVRHDLEEGVLHPYREYFAVTPMHNFYNEREWRYVPAELQDIISFNSSFLDENSMADFQQAGYVFDENAANQMFGHYLTMQSTFEPEFMPFTVDDIEVIFVASDRAQIALVERIENGEFTRIGGEDVDVPTAKKLITKIISYDFIKNNI